MRQDKQNKKTKQRNTKQKYKEKPNANNYKKTNEMKEKENTNKINKMILTTETKTNCIYDLKRY